MFVSQLTPLHKDDRSPRPGTERQVKKAKRLAAQEHNPLAHQKSLKILRSLSRVLTPQEKAQLKLIVARCEAAEGYHSAAQNTLDNVLEIARRNQKLDFEKGDALIERGKLYIAQQKLNKAIEAYNKAEEYCAELWCEKGTKRTNYLLARLTLEKARAYYCSPVGLKDYNEKSLMLRLRFLKNLLEKDSSKTSRDLKAQALELRTNLLLRKLQDQNDFWEAIPDIARLHRYLLRLCDYYLQTRGTDNIQYNRCLLSLAEFYNTPVANNPVLAWKTLSLVRKQIDFYESGTYEERALYHLLSGITRLKLERDQKEGKPSLRLFDFQEAILPVAIGHLRKAEDILIQGTSLLHDHLRKALSVQIQELAKLKALKELAKLNGRLKRYREQMRAGEYPIKENPYFSELEAWCSGMTT